MEPAKNLTPECVNVYFYSDALIVVECQQYYLTEKMFGFTPKSVFKTISI